MRAMAKHTCNIDAKGKAVRLIGGFITLLIAILLAVIILVGGLAPVWWWAVVGTLSGAAFQLYEGWSGWCALRAMGFKTPI
jgi:hypothetical protein